MNPIVLLGRQVKILENDFMPQDLIAHIKEVNEKDRVFLLEMETPLVSSKTTYTYVVASPRLSQENLETLLHQGFLGCCVTWVPNEKFEPNHPYDITWWRGGAAAITAVSLI